MNYYNEWDKGAAAWLRELIKAGHLPQGYVDERSITDVTASDLAGFTQCHFFAGIGGWSYALQLAGIPSTTRLWTGSPPCQPFSVAGKQLGQLDERHLAPAFMRLVDQCRPPVLFGEQVAAAIGKHWLDDLFAELERQGYACGAAVLPAASVGAPHKRDRLFFGAVGVAQPMRAERDGKRLHGLGESDQTQGSGTAAEFTGRGDPVQLADTGNGSRQPGQPRTIERGLPPRTGENAALRADPHHGFWASADWLGCRDGKFRPVEPGTFPLGDGIPARVGRLRGYGNAIVPQVAAEFIKAFEGAINDAGN